MSRALLSVTDKSGIVELAQGLHERGFTILSTGGTARTIKDAGIPVTAVADVTGFPEILDGRVKTLHPAIHGAILADRSNPAHMETMQEHGIEGIDLLVVNLYRFEETVNSEHQFTDAIEAIDIGGPAMIRASAKNHQHCVPVVDPNDYQALLDSLPNLSDEFKLSMAAKAFAHTAYYDSVISRYLGALTNPQALGETFTIGLRMKNALRYGENPHQSGGLFVDPLQPGGVANGKVMGDVELGFNNIADADAAYALVCDLDSPACVIVKHANPCGAAEATTAMQAFLDARDTDPISAFGGIVAFNTTLDRETAEAIVGKGNFFEVIIAPEIDPEALGVISERGSWAARLRLIQAKPASQGGLEIKSVSGGALIQSKDESTNFDWNLAAGEEANPQVQRALKIAWKCVKHVRSNAIVVAKQNRLLGIGAGQMNRVQSVRLALESAGEEAKGAVLASDAFFPFADSIEVAAEAGIVAIVQPGGSKRDAEVVEKAAELGITMYLTGYRHFKH